MSNSLTPLTDALWSDLMAACKKSGIAPANCEAFQGLEKFRDLERKLQASDARAARLEGELKAEQDLRGGFQLTEMALRHAMESQAMRILTVLSAHRVATPQEGYGDGIEWATSDAIRALNATVKERDALQAALATAQGEVAELRDQLENRAIGCCRELTSVEVDLMDQLMKDQAKLTASQQSEARLRTALEKALPTIEAYADFIEDGHIIGDLEARRKDAEEAEKALAAQPEAGAKS